MREIVRDTIIKLRADSSLIRALIECDSLGRARIIEIQDYYGGQRLRPPQIKIIDNTLIATAYCDSLELALAIKDREIKRLSKDKIVTTRLVEVYRLHWWQEALAWAGVVLILTVIITLIKNGYIIRKTR